MHDWDKLRVFLAVAEQESISFAAENLNTSQSAVSRTIADLEKSMKIQLFHRHPRGVKLTGAGEVLYKSVLSMKASLEEAQYLINVEQNRIVGPIRIMSSMAFGAGWLTDQLKEFNDIHPQIDITLNLNDEHSEFDYGRTDVLISAYQARESWLIQSKLTTLNYAIFATNDYLKINGTPQKPEDLANHKIITFGQTHLLGVGVNWLSTFGAPSNRPHKPFFRVNNLYGVYRAVLSNMGIACLPLYLGHRFGDLVQLFSNMDIKYPQIDVFFTYPEELKYLRRIKVLREFLLEKTQTWQY